MRKGMLLVNSVAGAAVLTMMTAAAVLLYLMFSTGEEKVRKEGLFGSVFFETTAAGNGVTGASLGVANPVGLIVVFVVCAVVLAFAQVIYRGLRQYRAQLIQERSDH